ncbi:MAG: hypothetical protein N2446_03395, partial [Elusimicrobiales bacterium]|nr:hypothetical protein [Elusimicrobiales bacterium]
MKVIPLNNKTLINFVVNNFQHLEGFLVGGCVRDWYLNKKCNDIDFTFKEYPKEVATYLIKKYKFKANEFPQFLTIRLLSKKNRIDLSSFRKEKYPKPASLPIVEKASSIEEDLYRRDFTSNAIAISLNKNKIFD